jgi:hypothetical protein
LPLQVGTLSVLIFNDRFKNRRQHMVGDDIINITVGIP